jgi:Zn-dependent protease
MKFKDILKNKWFLGVTFFLVYAVLINWKFAIILMVSLGFHESGHVWAMKRKGIKTSGFYFIPFIGGAAIAEEQFKSFKQQAYIAIMGPVWGMSLAFLTMIIGFITKNSYCGIIASLMAIFNLFNLLPLTLLDGGQVLKTIVLSVNPLKGFYIINIISIITAIIAFLIFKTPFIIIFALLSVIQTNIEKSNFIKSKGSALLKRLNKKEIMIVSAHWILTTIGLMFIYFLSQGLVFVLLGHTSIKID